VKSKKKKKKKKKSVQTEVPKHELQSSVNSSMVFFQLQFQFQVF